MAKSQFDLDPKVEAWLDKVSLAASNEYRVDYSMRSVELQVIACVHSTAPVYSQYADDRSAEGMKKGVADCTLFLAILSPNYFESWFCCLEMFTAIDLGKPIICVFNETRFKVQDALGWIPPDLNDLKNIEFLPIHEDIQMAKPCIERILNNKKQPFSGTKPMVIGKHSFLINDFEISKVFESERLLRW